ncbi:hypothetical protein JW977_00400 [Candidatus Falkowbacteria bacterium]|nr:hypothetical protein [Candidatus Falkowbacteria bacterium]
MDNKNIFIVVFAYIFNIGYIVFIYYFLHKNIVKDKFVWWEALIVFVGGFIASYLMIYAHGYYIKQIGGLIYILVLFVSCYLFIDIFDLVGERREAAKGSMVILSIIFIVGLGLLARNAYNDGKIFNKRQHQLEVKVKEVKKLKKALEKKIIEVRDLRSEYSNSVANLKGEILAESRAHNIVYYDQAIRNQRISYDLVLIQRKRAYIIKLDEISVRLKRGVVELEFIQRQTEDDVRLVAVLKNEKVNQIISDINEVISRYLPDTSKLEINIDPSEMQTPQQIWYEIIQENQ